MRDKKNNIIKLYTFEYISRSHKNPHHRNSPRVFMCYVLLLLEHKRKFTILNA